jgi:uroporphyrinogen-III synthase
VKILIIRPEPGASRTAKRAEAKGLDSVVAPLFSLEPVEWQPPGADGIDAVMISSPNAARLAGDALRRFTSLPCYAVGEASAEAAEDAGFGLVRSGPSDGQALLEVMAADSIRSAFHPCGRDHIPLSHQQIRIERRVVYASRPAERLSSLAEEAARGGALVLLHSPRAAAEFARLVDTAPVSRASVALAAISAAAAEAAGTGWLLKEVAAAPRDQALLELAAKLCQRMAVRDGK